MEGESEALSRIHMSAERQRHLSTQRAPSACCSADLWCWLNTNTRKTQPLSLSLSFTRTLSHKHLSECIKRLKATRVCVKKENALHARSVSYWSYGLLRAPKPSSDPDTVACAILNRSDLFFAESDIRFTWHYTCSGQKSKRWYSCFSTHAQQTVRLCSPAFCDHTHAPTGCVWCQSGSTCSVSKEGYLLRLSRAFGTSGLLLHFSVSQMISFSC